MFDLTEVIFAWDRRQSDPTANAPACAKDTAHGRLTIGANGRTLFCGKCDFTSHASMDDAMLAQLARLH